MPQPDQQDQGAPAQGAPDSQSGSGQQANQLQTTLGKLMQLSQTLGQQNPTIQPEMAEVASSIRKAFLKTVQAGQQPQPEQAPPGQ